MYSAKISLLFFNRRITSFTSGWWTRVHYTYLAILVIFFVISVSTLIFPCTPVGAHFSLYVLLNSVEDGLNCWPTQVSYNILVAIRVLHIFSDVMLLALPIVVLSRLQMPRQKKIAIGMLFCFGIICTVASIMRIALYQEPTIDWTCKSLWPIKFQVMATPREELLLISTL